MSGENNMLTRRHKKLLAEIDSIATRAALDHWNIEDYPPAARTIRLGIIKDSLVRSEVIMRYTFLDECLAIIICRAYFPDAPKNGDFRPLWRTKKFKAFAYHILDSLYLLNKMRLVNDLKPVPNDVRDFMERLNALRNAMAHSFFPANRYQYRKHKKVIYRDRDIYSVEGFSLFREEAEHAADYFYKQAYGKYG
jgi:hypothetical protein